MKFRLRGWGIFALVGLELLAVAPAAAALTEAPAKKTLVNFAPLSGLHVQHGSSSLSLQLGTWLRGDILDRAHESTRYQFAVPLLRPVLQVHLLNRQLLFFVQPELGGASPDPRLLDAFIEWAPRDQFHLRFGQFRTPFSRAFIIPIFNLQLPGRGLVVDHFRLGRDSGAMAFGSFSKHRFEYAVGGFSGADINSLASDDAAPLALARIAFNLGQPVPYDQAPALVLDAPSGVSFGLSGAWRDRSHSRGNTPSTPRPESWHGQADVTLMRGPVAATAEAFLKETRSPGGGWRDSYGTFLQLGAFVLPRQLEIGGRGGWLSDGGDAWSTEAFVTLYWHYGDMFFGHHLKTTLAYRRDDHSSAASARDFQSVVLQTQIWL